MRISLRWKIVLMLLILTLLPSLFLGFTNYRMSNRILQGELESSTGEIVNRTTASFDLFMDSMEETVAMLSQDANAQQIYAVESSKAWMMETFKSVADTHDNIQAVYLGTRDKEMLIYPHADLSDDFDPQSRGWYKGAVENNSLYWTDVYEDAVTGNMTITVAVPVYNNKGNNEFVGVVGIDISLDNLALMITDVTIGEAGFLSLTDKDGVFIIHPDKSPIGSVIPVPELKEAVLSTDADNQIVNYTYNKTANGELENIDYEKVFTYSYK